MQFVPSDRWVFCLGDTFSFLASSVDAAFGNLTCGGKVTLIFSNKKGALIWSTTIPITANGPKWPSVALLKCLNERVKEEEMADKLALSWNIYMHKYYGWNWSTWHQGNMELFWYSWGVESFNQMQSFMRKPAFRMTELHGPHIYLGYLSGIYI